MKYFLLGIFISVLLDSFGQAQEDTIIVEDKDNQCGEYCFKVLKPILEHISIMQTRWEECDTNKLANTSYRLDKIESQLVEQEAKDVFYSKAIEETKLKLTEQKSLFEKHTSSLRSAFQKIGSKYYYIEDVEPLNWFAAAHKCLSFGAHLISLDDPKQRIAIAPKLKENYGYWIDINDLGKEGNFLSLTTGLRPKFLNWRAGEPNNAGTNEHCALISGASFLMNDFKCGESRYFICESFNE